MSKITDYAALTSAVSDDVTVIVDVHDTSMASSGTTKKITVANLLAGRLLTPTAVKTSGYTAAAGDFVPCDTTSASFTVTLPAAPADLTLIAVKMVTQGASNTVTVARGGSDVFNKTGGSTSLTLSLPNQGLLLLYKASLGVWYVAADDLPLSQVSTVKVANAVTDFGAVGDGSHDDTTALQAFFTAIATGGSKAGYLGYLPAGTYKITSALAGGTHTRCAGAGKYATTIQQWTAGQDVLQFNTGTMLGVELADFSLAGPYRVDTTGTSTTNGSATVGDTHAAASDLNQAISGTGIPGGATITAVTPGTGYTISAAATATGTPALTIAGGSAGVGLNLNNWIDTCNAKRMIISGNSSHGVLLQNSYVNSWEHVWFYNNGGDGLHAATSINAVKFDNCEYFGNAGNGASVDGAAGIQFAACDFETNGQHGLKFPHVYSGLVSACDFENNGTSSPGTTYAALYVDATSGYAGVSVIGCNLTGTGATTANGVEVTANCTAFHIDDCSFNNFALNDILIDSGATGVVIGKNLVHQAGSGAFITDSGTSTTYLAAPDTAALPSDINLKAWNFDPQTTPGTSVPTYSNYTAGVVFLAKVAVRHPMLVSKIAVYWSAPSGGSPLNAYFGLYNPAGTRVDVTSDISAAATGLKAFALGSSHNIAAGTYYVAYVIGTQGTTSGGPWYAANVPGTQFSVLTGAFGDLAVTAANYRWAKQLTGQTSLPSSLTLSSNSGTLGGAGNAQPFWCGLL